MYKQYILPRTKKTQTIFVAKLKPKKLFQDVYCSATYEINVFTIKVFEQKRFCTLLLERNWTTPNLTKFRQHSFNSLFQNKL